MQQLTIDVARALGREGMQRAADKADRQGFDTDGALRCIVGHVRRHGPTSGEDLVQAAQEHGYRPRDGRAFGAVFKAAVKPSGGLVVLRSDLPRRAGHGCSGGRLYGVAV